MTETNPFVIGFAVGLFLGACFIWGYVSGWFKKGDDR